MILALTILFILIVIVGCSISHLVGYNKGFNDATQILKKYASRRKKSIT